MAYRGDQKLMAKLSELIKKREFTVGVLTVVVIATVGLLLVRETMKRSGPAHVAQRREVSQPSHNNSTQGTTPTAQPKKEPVSQIKKLADTAGAIVTFVESNDNYWKISQRSCGTGRYYLSIQAYNNNKPLHPGDAVLVRCEE